jgi:hypothetical protein
LILVVDCFQWRKGEVAGGRADTGEFRGDDEELVLLRNKVGKGVREARRAEAKWVEVRREAAAYRRWQNRPEKLAGTAESGEKSGQPGGVSGEIGRGETQRGSRAIYRHGSGKKRKWN